MQHAFLFSPVTLIYPFHLTCEVYKFWSFFYPVATSCLWPPDIYRRTVFSRALNVLPSRRQELLSH